MRHPVQSSVRFFRPLTLLYHTVSDTWDDPLAVGVDDFEHQLTSLVNRGFRGGSAADILQRPGARKLLHVTFDDGYRSVENALPALRRHRLPASIFVCPDFMAEGANHLMIAEMAGRAPNGELETLDWSALREIVSEGLVEIGSHTSSHAHLTQLSDAELSRELGESKAAIEDNLGRPCTTMAYPFGQQDARVRRAVAASGYTAAFAAPGISTRRDPLQIPRTSFWRGEARRRQAVKTRFVTRVAVEWRRRRNASSLGAP